MIQQPLQLFSEEKWKLHDSAHRCPTCNLRVNYLHREYHPEHYKDANDTIR